MIDLHMHSRFSDGSESPEELVELAATIGLSAISLTDHDSVDGIPRFMAAGERFGMRTIPGVELSVDSLLPSGGHLHMLGLFVDHTSTAFRARLDFLSTERRRRADRIIQRLNDLGIQCSMHELNEIAGDGAIGRPHIAKILIDRGVVVSIQEAFDQFLSKGKPAYIEKVKLNEAGAIDLIHSAGGLAILAHPQFMNFDTMEAAFGKISELQAIGLNGVEAFYPGMPEEFAHQLRQFACSAGLVLSGGSDFHGTVKADTQMGTGIKNDLAIDDAVLFDLDNYHHQRRISGR